MTAKKKKITRTARRTKNKLPYTKDENGNVHITYAAYDEETERVERIKRRADEPATKSRNMYMYKTSFPTVQNMEGMNLEKHFGDYFPYLLFYYDNDIPELHNNAEYMASKKYLNKLFLEKVIFDDDEDEE